MRIDPADLGRVFVTCRIEQRFFPPCCAVGREPVGLEEAKRLAARGTSCCAREDRAALNALALKHGLLVEECECPPAVLLSPSDALLVLRGTLPPHRTFLRDEKTGAVDWAYTPGQAATAEWEFSLWVVEADPGPPPGAAVRALEALRKLDRLLGFKVLPKGGEFFKIEPGDMDGFREAFALANEALKKAGGS